MKILPLIVNVAVAFAALNNCPMAPISSIILRATEATQDPAIQMQMIRRIVEDIFGGSWGVIIIKNPALVSKEIHWTIPDHNSADGNPAFCLALVKGRQYNVFKTGTVDDRDRVTVEGVVRRIQQSDEKQRPSRMTVQQFDKKLATAIRLGN